MTFTISEKKQLIERINELDNQNHYINIFNIFINNKIPFTKNKNGIFIRFNKVPDNVLLCINEYINNISYDDNSVKDDIVSSDTSTEKCSDEFINDIVNNVKQKNQYTIEDDISKQSRALKLSNHDKSLINHYNKYS